MNCLLTFIVILSTYVMFESLAAIAKMPAGLIHFCCKIKYVLSFSSSIAFIYYALHFNQILNATEFQFLLNLAKSGLWLVFGSVGTLAFFVWPRTVYRFKQYMKILDEFESEFL